MLCGRVPDNLSRTLKLVFQGSEWKRAMQLVSSCGIFVDSSFVVLFLPEENSGKTSICLNFSLVTGKP